MKIIFIPSIKKGDIKMESPQEFVFVPKRDLPKRSPSTQKKKESKKRFIHVYLLHPQTRETLIDTNVRTLQNAADLVNEKLDSLSLQEWKHSNAALSMLLNYNADQSNRKFKKVGFPYIVLSTTKFIDRKRKDKDGSSPPSSEGSESDI